MKINYERIKYSPFGKKITKAFRISLILSLCTLPLGTAITLLMFSAERWLGLTVSVIFIGVPIWLTVNTVRGVLFEARLLSDMTDEKHNRLIAEYKKYEERNIIRYGHLTSYGWVLDTRILPWKNIERIEIKPGEYRYVRTAHGGHMEYFPAKVRLTCCFDKKKVEVSHSIANEDYDLSDEISRLLESIPTYTEHKFAVDNEYYYAK